MASDITYKEMRDIVIGKLVDHTIDDDFEALSERLFGDGNCFSSSETRKRMYGMKAIIEAIDRETLESVTDIDVLREMDQKRVELQKEKQRFFDQRREYNKLINEDGRRENLEARLIQAAMQLGETVGDLYQGTFMIGDGLYSDAEAVLVLNDWHYGLVADNIFNYYNTSVCKDRVRKVIESAIERILLHHCKTLRVVVLGDLFHGAIHTSARVASEELVCDQIMQVSEILAQSIEELSRYVEQTFVYMTYGNHARTVQNKKDSIHRDNMERLIPWWLRQRLAKHENIVIVEDEGNEYLFFESCGHGVCASHGDLDGVKGSPRLVATLFNKCYGRDVEYILLGDKHHIESFDELGIYAMMSGSLCGTDDYANEKRLFSTPSQLLLIMTPEIGVDAEYRIRCA